MKSREGEVRLARQMLVASFTYYTLRGRLRSRDEWAEEARGRLYQGGGDRKSTTRLEMSSMTRELQASPPAYLWQDTTLRHRSARDFAYWWWQRVWKVLGLTIWQFPAVFSASVFSIARPPCAGLIDWFTEPQQLVALTESIPPSLTRGCKATS